MEGKVDNQAKIFSVDGDTDHQAREGAVGVGNESFEVIQSDEDDWFLVAEMG